MDDLAFDAAMVASWFTDQPQGGYLLVSVGDATTATWMPDIGRIVRRCYITDDAISANARRVNLSPNEIIAARLPNPGPVMSGDFGEILTYLYQSARLPARAVIGVKKWRLKQDRTKPAPYSDVVHFVVPHWPRSSPDDALYCAEVKAKATAGTSAPIADAIRDSEKDRVSRLTKTLLWLHERARTEDLGDPTLELIERFCNPSDHPLPRRVFRAVAVLCGSVSTAELGDVPGELPAHVSLVVIVVPELQGVYTAVFEAAKQGAS